MGFYNVFKFLIRLFDNLAAGGEGAAVAARGEGAVVAARGEGAVVAALVDAAVVVDVRGNTSRLVPDPWRLDIRSYSTIK